MQATNYFFRKKGGAKMLINGYICILSKSNYIFTPPQAVLFSLSLSDVAVFKLKQMGKQQTNCYNRRHCKNQINQDKLVGRFKGSLSSPILTRSGELWQPNPHGIRWVVTLFWSMLLFPSVIKLQFPGHSNAHFKGISLMGTSNNSKRNKDKKPRDGA